MHCPSCDRDSTNRRVCPYCFTPFPKDEPATGSSRQSAGGQGGWPGQTGRATEPTPSYLGGLWAAIMRLSPVARWSGAGILIVLALWVFTGGEDTDATEPPAGVVIPLDQQPMSREEAESLLRRTRESALVESQADEVFVSYAAATYPLTREGQIVLVRLYARADEIVEGRRRRIFFYSPNGRKFAQSDGVTGVTMVD